MARDYGMNRQGLYPQEESRAGTLPFYRRGMKAKGGTVRMKKGGSAVVDDGIFWKKLAVSMLKDPMLIVWLKKAGL